MTTNLSVLFDIMAKELKDKKIVITWEGDCDLSDVGEEITCLPPMHVKGDLFICNLQVESLPDNMTVDGTLDAGGSYLKTIPASLKVTNLNLDQSNIGTLPENFRIEGYLNLNTTKIRELPSSLYVGGDLCVDSDVRIPESVFIGGKLFIDNKPQTKPDAAPAPA
ncbi:MAG: hypothetical protein L6Q57_04210 [Alphaproteobacteria bacterium]|nr:hypothetical protein [Alphaproteobacteria bacterium]